MSVRPAIARTLDTWLSPCARRDARSCHARTPSGIHCSLRLGTPSRSLSHQSTCVRSAGRGARYILAALGRNNGNRTLPAGQIGIGPAMLFRKLKRYSDGPWSLLLVAEAWARVVEFSTSL
ncbi:MAG: helix-turn-helix domain-containing protein [Vicinamibacterales bacterium]